MISWAIMAILAVIATGVFVKQFYYDPTVLTPSGLEFQGSKEADLVDFVPADMDLMNPVESFEPRNLFEKINGKAELYLSAGFVNLRSQRFEKSADPQSWMEVFVYDMGTLRRAFAVYCAQRRAEAKPLALTPFSYSTRNALFWVHGKYYVEIVASVSSEQMTQAMLSFGQDFVRQTSVERETMDELALFPREHQDEGSIVLLLSDAFGFDGMENVFTARYHIAGEKVTAFLSQQRDLKEAEELVEAYQDFLMANGGTRIASRLHLAGATLVEILDSFEIVFRHGRYVAGVHEAETQEAAEKLGLMLKDKLAEAFE
jgi:hypothetical protein